MKKVNIGILSAGTMAQAHMEAVNNSDDAVLTAVCDIVKSKAQSAAEKYNIKQVYFNYQELLNDNEVDAVIICAPDQFHREMTIAALEAGKHVLCEKPMALTREDYRAMLEVSCGHPSQVLMVGQICRYTPGFFSAKKLIDRGEIGELFFVESEYAHDYAKILDGEHAWRKDPLRHACLGGCHPVDLIRWIAGDPVEVMAYGNKKMLTDLASDDCLISIFKFPKDIIGKVFISIGCKRDYTMRSVFYGSKGTIVADNTNPYIIVFKEAYSPGDSLFEKLSAQTVPVHYPVTLSSHNTYDELTDFVGAIMHGIKVTVDGTDGAKTVEVCLSLIESIQSGLPVKINYYIP
jgi:predicted dehydrogenase